METYTVFSMIGFNELTPEGNYLDTVDLEIIAENEVEARSRAESLVDKKDFLIKSASQILKKGKELAILFGFQCYTEKVADGRLLKNITVSVIADNEKEALDRVKKMVNKPLYRLAKLAEDFI